MSTTNSLLYFTSTHLLRLLGFICQTPNLTKTRKSKQKEEEQARRFNEVVADYIDLADEILYNENLGAREKLKKVDQLESERDLLLRQFL